MIPLGVWLTTFDGMDWTADRLEAEPHSLPALLWTFAETILLPRECDLIRLVYLLLISYSLSFFSLILAASSSFERINYLFFYSKLFNFCRLFCLGPLPFTSGSLYWEVNGYWAPN